MRLLLIFGLVAFMSPGHGRVSDNSTLASATIDTSHPGATISPTFMGFSHEWGTAQQMIGSNSVYRRLVQNLLAYGAGPLIVRVGGNSTDSTTEPAPDVVAPFAQLYADLGTQFILGVNLGANDVSLATDQARAYVQGMPPGSLIAIEIGNEPDLFHDNGHRPPAYTYPDYAQEFSTWRSMITTSLENLPPRLSGEGGRGGEVGARAAVSFLGPSWASASSLKNLASFLDDEGQYLALVSHHWYAGTQCNARTNPANYLLRPQSAMSGATAVKDAVQLTHRRGLPFRMGEMNSISCGGEAGVSDVFASALWATDSMFELASVGVDGVNIHTGNGGGYALFAFNPTPTVRPEYYGLLLFQEAAPGGSQLLPVALQTSANLKTWATIDSTGAIRVTVINEAETAAGDVSIQVESATAARLVRLEAPSLDSKTGVSLGGQTFDGSSDGTLQGAPMSETVVPDAGSYTFQMPPVSAAVLTIPASTGV